MESSRLKAKRKTEEHITPRNGDRHGKTEQELDGARKEGPGQISKNDLQKLGSSTVNSDTVNEMRNLCKQTRSCTLRLTQCISPAFEDLKCEIDPLLIQMCRDFNIQVKDNGDSGEAVCV
ncbi:unnamed protein product [Schistosoma mattheei]|uniref:Uncharacterized protein n=1 Tax=Schistosoma mattheei TaxID=31246 RepID=A0A183PXU5_9TREM|nr:unnamed protein product [Schistosoma mattheei]